MSTKHANTPPVLILMAEQRCAPVRKRPQPLAPAPLMLDAAHLRAGPRRPETPAPAARSARPRPILPTPAPRTATPLRPLAEESARLTGLRGQAFAQDAIRLPGMTARRPAVRGLNAAPVTAMASPAIGTVLLGLLAGLRIG